MTDTTFIGNIGEQIAADYLEEKGYTILERNIELCGCEVDIIAEAYFAPDGTVIKQNKRKCPFRILFSSEKRKNSGAAKSGNRTLVFCEVKTRRDDGYGTGAEAVTPYKVRRYVTAVKAYTAGKFDVNTDIRFDIIEVGGDGAANSVNHIENAFTADDAAYRRK